MADKKFSNLIKPSKCVQLKELHKKMGIIEVAPYQDIEFTKSVTRTKEVIEPDPIEIEVSEDLKNGKEITFKDEDLRSDENEGLTYKGRKVIAYIKDQNIGKFGAYKYHLCNCKTLKDMDNAGRQKKYCITNNISGIFPVFDVSDPQRPEEKKIKLTLCKNCIEVLRKKGLFFKNFNLEEYFKRYDSYVPETIKKPVSFTQQQTYTPNHKEQARKYKKQVNYICERCEGDFSQAPHLLHLHHINGVKSNNYRDNLKVYCVICHSKQPMHSHLLEENKDDVEAARKLRNAQGIIDLEEN